MGPSELRQRRDALQLTQAELARAVGVARNAVARWERGELRFVNPHSWPTLSIDWRSVRPRPAPIDEPPPNRYQIANCLPS